MDKKQLVTKLAAVVVSLAESSATNDAVPASTLYLALGMDLSAYEQIVMVGQKMGWVIASPTTVRLTPKGRELAAELAPAFA